MPTAGELRAWCPVCWSRSALLLTAERERLWALAVWGDTPAEQWQRQETLR